MFLTLEELTELTGRRRSDAHRRALDSMGVQYKVRPDGTVAVLKAHVEALFSQSSHKRKTAPNFSLVS